MSSVTSMIWLIKVIYYTFIMILQEFVTLNNYLLFLLYSKIRTPQAHQNFLGSFKKCIEWQFQSKTKYWNWIWCNYWLLLLFCDLQFTTTDMLTGYGKKKDYEEHRAKNNYPANRIMIYINHRPLKISLRGLCNLEPSAIFRTRIRTTSIKPYKKGYKTPIKIVFLKDNK